MISAKHNTITGKFGDFKALVISGDVAPLKSNLLYLGFKEYSKTGEFWMASKNVTPILIEKLKILGITIGESTPAVTTPTSPQAPEQHLEQSKQWVSEEPEMTKWYGFPINKNIQSYQETTNVDGKDYKVDISIDRSYVMGGDTYHKTKSREFKGKPRYKIHIAILDIKDPKNPSDPYKQTYNYTSKQLWGSYDENTFLNTTLKEITKNVLNNPQKVPGVIRYENEISKRTPEYKQFLNDIKEDKITPTFTVHITDPQYEGDYKVEVSSLGVSDRCLDVYLETKLEQEGAPRATTVSYGTKIDGTYTIDDFNKKVQDFINNTGHDKIQENYVKYLKSFPCLQEQKTEAGQSVEEMKNILINPMASVNKVFDEIKARGYIRPHKRQKQYTGLTTGDEITWIVDSKKIVNDAYSFGSYLSHTPDYFYAVVAYYIHRKHRNISSWTDMMLRDSMATWRSNMAKYGINLDINQIDAIVSSIGNAIYDIFSKKAEYFDQEAQAPKENVAEALRDFENLAQQYGISTEGLEQNVKNIYRTLTKTLHPDLVQDPQEKLKREEEFKKLQEIYDAIPQQYKLAYSWYDKYIESKNIRTIIISSIKRNV